MLNYRSSEHAINANSPGALQLVRPQAGLGIMMRKGRRSFVELEVVQANGSGVVILVWQA